MSVSKAINSSKCSARLSRKESRSRHSLSKEQKVRSVPTAVSSHLPSRSGSIREEFIKALRVADKSDRTIKSYCDAVRMFQNFIHKHPLNVTVNDIRAFFFI